MNPFPSIPNSGRHQDKQGQRGEMELKGKEQDRQAQALRQRDRAGPRTLCA